MAAIGISGALLLSLAACTTTAPQPAAPPANDEPVLTAPIKKPVVRYGRYTLVELTPEETQRDLMAQVVDVSIPLAQGMAEVTVGEAIRHVLRRSGYRLCDTPQGFEHLPLPVAHSHLGPIKLRDALMILAGSAWTLQVDESTRQVCFVAAVQDETSKASGGMQ